MKKMRPNICINLVITILFLVGQFDLAFSQIGEYCLDDFLWSSCYTLLPDNRFNNEELMCVAQYVGQGHYEKTQDSIIFHYEPIDFFEKQIQIERLNGDSEKLLVKLNVINYDTQEQIDTIQISYLKNEITYISDKNLDEFIELETDQFPLSLFISAKDYSFFKIELSKSGHYFINLNLKKGIKRDEYDVKTGTERFKIVQESEELLILTSDIFIGQLEFKKTK